MGTLFLILFFALDLLAYVKARRMGYTAALSWWHVLPGSGFVMLYLAKRNG